jgi:NADH-quinone oxidoreductase subunit M
LYGLIRWYIPFVDIKIPMIQNVAILLSVFGVVYGALIALRRNNLKQIAAFSSLSHVGLIAAGIFTANIYGLQGSIIQMVVHGINILGLFYIIDIIKNQTGTLNIQKLGGIASKAPKFAVLSLIIILGTIGVPLTNGFPGEMLLLMSVFIFNPYIGSVAGITIIIGAAYMLRVYQLTFFRTVTGKTENFTDISGVDFVALLIIAFLVLSIGFYPQFILDLSQTTSNHLVNLLSSRVF